MRKERITYLYQQFLSGSLSPEEAEEWSSLLEDHKLEAALNEAIDNAYDNIAVLEIQNLPGNRSQEIFDFIISQSPAHAKQIKLWPRILTVAAATIGLLGICVFMYQQFVVEKQVGQIVYANDVKPGKEGATLTLSNGKKINVGNVANGELAKESGVVIRKTENGQIVYDIQGQGSEDAGKLNTLSTVRGQTYQVMLPDGTKIWLNASSTLKYPANFGSLKGTSKRVVVLTGEAYFEVAKNKSHPFVVETDQQNVEVLGTHFNINSYADEPSIKTTLLEGIVKVSSKSLNAETVLKPGEQALLAPSGTIAVKETDGDDAIAWTSSKYTFEQETMESIMRTLSRWYDIEVEFQGNSRNKTFGGTISRKENLAMILDKIAFTGGVHFKIEGRRITVRD